MRNRAKCRLCGDIVESKHQHDYVSCSCEEIAVDGGNAYHRACFKNRENFIALDDDGNEIIPKHEKDEKEPVPQEKLAEYAKEVMKSPPNRPSKEDLIRELDEMVKNIENLPPQALYAPINHADFGSLLILLHAILKRE